MITVVAVAPSTVICMSTGTESNVGEDVKGPGTGKPDEDAGAKEHHFNIWDED